MSNTDEVIPGLGNEDDTELLKDDTDSLPDEIDENNGFEPGELPSAECGGDKIVDVLEDILGGNDGIHDDLQKELDDSASKKSTPKTKRAKTAPKKKTSRKTKTIKGAEETKPAKDKLEGAPAVTTEKDPSNAKVKAVKNTSSEKKEISSSVAVKSEPKVETKIPKTKEKIVTKPAITTKNTDKVEASPKVIKSAPSKAAKPTTPKVTKTNKKEKKAPEEKPKKVIKSEEAPVLDEKAKEKDKVELEKKVKDLEKQVTVTESEKPGKNKKEKSSSERKRKASETSGKELKTKKSKDIKVKAEKTDKKEDEMIEADLIPEFFNEQVGDMKVIDDMDHNPSDNESHYSNASSFSHTFSHSASFTGSFTGSFSGSLSLSDLSGSLTSLDSLGKEKHTQKKKKRRASVHEEVEEIEAEHHKEFISSLLKGARYFIVKSNNHENVTLSKAKGVWATPPANERKLNDAYRHSTNVILVFSVKESGRFQGFARLASESRHDGIPIPWVLPAGFDRRILGGTFKVDWLNRKDVSFSDCQNLRNPWNENKEVKICRDGQELEPSIGEKLCNMFEDDITIDLNRISRHLKQRKKLGDYFGNKRESRPHGGIRGYWRGGRGDFRGSFRGDRGRIGGRRGFGNRDGGRGRQFHNGRFNQYRGGPEGSGNFEERPHNRHHHSHDRTHSRSPDYRKYDRESRDRKHRDKVKEFLKNDRSKFGVRKETLLHGSYSDYVREFQRQKERHTSYYNPSNYQGSSSSRYDPNVAAEEFLRRR